MDNLEFVSALSDLKRSATFMSISGYKSESNEVSNFSIVFNVSYQNALINSIEILQNLSLTDPLEIQAREELIQSFRNSLEKHEDKGDDIDDGYARFQTEDGKVVKGVKLHEKTNTLHIFGFLVHKNILVPGEKKNVNKRPLTIAKDKLRALCPVSKYRQFKITPSTVDCISVQNKVINI